KGLSGGFVFGPAPYRHAPGSACLPLSAPRSLLFAPSRGSFVPVWLSPACGRFAGFSQLPFLLRKAALLPVLPAPPPPPEADRKLPDPRCPGGHLRARFCIVQRSAFWS